MDPSKPAGRSSWAKLAEPEMLVALSAVVVGVCALIVSVVQVRIMRAEQHTAVWPRLHMEQHYAAGQSLRYVLVNRGLGPAVIQDVRISIDDQPRTSWSAITETLAPSHTPTDRVVVGINGRIVPAGESVTAFSTADTVLVDAMADRIGRLAICYCSVYEQCWTLTRSYEQDLAPEPERVRACPTAEAGRFMD